MRTRLPAEPAAATWLDVWLDVVRIVASALAACALAAAAPAAAQTPGAHWAGPPFARAARTVHISETARLHLTSEGETSLAEQGYAWGTFSAPLSARLNLSPGHVSAVFTLHPRGGTLVGRASARFIVRGSTGYYGGTLSIVRGSGTYRKAAGTNIGISGTINRYSFALTVKAEGWMRL